MANEASSKTAKPAGKGGKGEGTDLRQPAHYRPDVHRLLPQSPDAEKGVLCSYLLAPREVGGFCAEKQITPAHFHIPAHGELFGVLQQLWDANKPIDFIILTELLRDTQRLDMVGGAAFVTELFTFLPTAANLAYYVEIVQEKHTLREIIKVCTEYAARSYDEQDNVPNLLDDVEGKIFAIAQDRFKDKAASMKDQVMQAIHAIEELYERRGAITGLPTGLAEFDKMTDGLHAAEMIVIAARPSMGKTALAMNMAEHIALEEKKAVAVFSLEMSTSQLVQRMLCSRARVNLGNVRNGFLSERDFPALTAAASKLAESKFFIDDTPGLSNGKAGQIGRASCRERV